MQQNGPGSCPRDLGFHLLLSITSPGNASTSFLDNGWNVSWTQLGSDYLALKLEDYFPGSLEDTASRAGEGVSCWMRFLPCLGYAKRCGDNMAEIVPVESSNVARG